MNPSKDEKMPLEPLKIREYIDRTARNVVEYMIGENLKLSAAESCTGGLICSAITSVSGASKVFGYGAVTYSEEAKSAMIGVSEETIARCGVVSRETALEMAEGIKKLSKSDLAIAVTGLAGPKSEGDTLPVGTVYLAVIYKDFRYCENLKLYEYGELDRRTNRLLTAALALKAAFEALTGAYRKEDE